MFSQLAVPAIFIAISLSTGYIFLKMGFNFFVGTVLGACFQYIVNYIIQNFINLQIAVKNKQLENERIKQFTLQGLEVECPCSRKIKDFVPIRLNTANKYKCSECQKLISVYIQPTTALITEPIEDTDTTRIESIIHEFRK